MTTNDISLIIFLLLYATDTWLHLRSARRLSPDRGKWKRVVVWRVLVLLVWCWGFLELFGHPGTDRSLILLDATYALAVAGNAWRVLRGREWHLLIWAADHL